ncbi:MAG: hypothetical protein FWE88_01420 [Phycisphaerae bacterium]|nr:hypothetical protein [Phycisphaerae bacterium]
MTQGTPPSVPPAISTPEVDPARRSPIPYECAGRTATLFWRTVWMVMCRTGCIFSPDTFSPQPKRSRSFRRWAVFMAVLGVGVGMFSVAGMKAATRSGGSDEAILVMFAIVAGSLFLHYGAFTLMMRVVQWLSVPPTASRQWQQQSLIRIDYLAAPLVLFLVLFPMPLCFVLDKQAYPIVMNVCGILVGMIWLYWLIVVLVGLKNLTGRSGGAMIGAGAKLILAWLVIGTTISTMPLTVMMWSLLVGSL